MGMWACQQSCVQHSGHFNVIGINRLTRRQLDGVDLRLRFTDNAVTLNFRRRNDDGWRCTSARLDITAARIVPCPTQIPEAAKQFRWRGNGALQRFEWRHFFPTHDSGCSLNRLHNFHVASLTVEHAVDRKSTRLNSSHVKISYAGFCLKKKKKK